MMRSDLDTAVFVAGVELAAASVYSDAVASELLDEAAMTLCDRFAAHHRDHAEAFSGLAGRDVPAEGNASVLARYRPEVAVAANQQAMLELVHRLEERIVSTHLSALGSFTDRLMAESAATVLGVECKHATVLAGLLRLPLTQACPEFEADAVAFDPTEFPA